MHIEEIKKLLPHRYPFLLVDRVIEHDAKRIVAYKNLTVNEDFFNGHFPEAPIMPGVMQIEALAQTGLICMMKHHVSNPDEVLIVFSAINKAKFRRQVVPGDQLMMEVNVGEMRRNFVTMAGKATVEGKLACEVEITAAVVDKPKA